MTNKIIVLSAPRSGTHMLVRMISKSQKIPWLVPVSSKQIKNIDEENYVIGVHEEYHEVLKHCYSDTKIICIKRINGHKDSLKNFKGAENFNIEKIVESFPENLTVIYDKIILQCEQEIEKIKNILQIQNIEYESWSNRYVNNYGWRE